jgi:hypothetical protein
VGSSKAGSPHIPGAKSQIVPESSTGSEEASREKGVASQGGTKQRKLVAYQTYFGLEARTLHAGAKRTLERLCAHAAEPVTISVRSLGEDFGLDSAASGTLLRAFLAGGLLYPDGNGSYYATSRFREYALAKVVVPLSRSEAKNLINAACGAAALVNADSDAMPFLIDTMLVSGSYMSLRGLVPELSLWLLLRRRHQSRQHSTGFLSKDEALRRIRTTISGLSPVIAVRIVPDKQNVPRPFSVVFQKKEETIEPPTPTWERLRDWSVSIGRRVVPRRDPVGLPSAVLADLVTLQRTRTLQRDRSPWGKVGKRD